MASAYIKLDLDSLGGYKTCVDVLCCKIQGLHSSLCYPCFDLPYKIFCRVCEILYAMPWGLGFFAMFVKGAWLEYALSLRKMDAYVLWVVPVALIGAFSSS